MVGVVILPLAVSSRQNDVVLQQPVADQLDAFGAAMIIDHVGSGQVHDGARPDGIVVANESDGFRIGDTTSNQFVAMARQRLARAVGDLAGESESAWRIAERA